MSGEALNPTSAELGLPIHGETDLLAYLDRHGIAYQRVEHPPVFTCEEAKRYRPPLPAIGTKNLFLRDTAGHFFLALTACEKQLDLKKLRDQIGVWQAGWGKKLHFGSPGQLMDTLGVTPGAVTILGLANDLARRVHLLVDSQYWSEDYYLCHPLVNTATLVLAKDALLRFCEVTGHQPVVIAMAGR